MGEMISGKGPRALFVLTICVGSFLLFLVQPMIARMALPRLGGAPSVWNSAMLVYQALLLAGYAYAHWLGKLQARRQAQIHVAAFAIVAIMLPIGLMAGELPPNANPVFWVPWMLLSSIGPLFLVVSAQAPLMQRWYTLSGGENPYPLYAASNLGSFAGLISYPLLVEPLLSVGKQSLVWSIGYGLLFILAALCARVVMTSRHIETTSEETVSTPSPDWGTVGKWILLASVPSGLMLATSLHLTTDIVAMPLLWVLPLGLYLLSFSIAFADNQSTAKALRPLAPFFVLLAACGVFISGDYTLVYAALSLTCLFLVSVALHNMMYDARPAPEHLTRFYLAMSVGGVLGGIFCALISPVIFNWTFEYPLLLIASAALMTREPLFEWANRFWVGSTNRSLGLLAFSLAVLALSLVGYLEVPGLSPGKWDQTLIMVILFACLIAIGNRSAFAIGTLAVMLCLGGWDKVALANKAGSMTRSFFGVYAINETPGKFRTLVHGTTIHGIQNLATGRELIPTTYYAPRSGVGLAFAAMPQVFGPNAKLSVVGLGAGTLACYAKPGQDWQFYEIDPVIEHIARDPKKFTFLSRCKPDAQILIGDARIVLARQPKGQRDALVVDAFSSDSVPMHLLTKEAFGVYGRHLKPEGLLLVHISNRYLDLRPVLSAIVKSGWHARMRSYLPGKEGEALNFSSSHWVVLSRSPETLDKLEKATPPKSWNAFPDFGTRYGWTDDYASILPVIDWKL